MIEQQVTPRSVRGIPLASDDPVEGHPRFDEATDAPCTPH
jgi:hypothetical protein